MKKYKKRGVNSASTAPTVKNKTVNIPPANSDMQEIPRSLREFMKLKELSKNGGDLRRNEKFRQPKTNNRSNADVHFKNKTISKETYGHKNVISDELESSCNSSENEPKKRVTIKKKRKLKFMKLKLKRKLKKNKNEEDEEDKKNFVRDDIKFGEVVHRPPQLSVLPRKVTKMNFSNRPGRKDDLLLKSILKRSHLK